MTDQQALPLPAARYGLKALGVVAVLLLLYYPLGMIWVHRIDADPGFSPPANALASGKSQAVAMAQALVDREVNHHRWTANDPFFLPAAALDNMPNFQQGVVAAVSRFAIELTDQIARTRGSSEVDPDLDKALGFFQRLEPILTADNRRAAPLDGANKGSDFFLQRIVATNFSFFEGEVGHAGRL